MTFNASSNETNETNDTKEAITRKQHIIIGLLPSIRQELKSVSWWDDVHEDIKTHIEFIVANLWHLGVLFKSTFFNIFWLETNRRYLNNAQQHGLGLATYMVSHLHLAVSDEVYQCGLIATRAALGICDSTTVNDAIRPNDADVMICIFLCKIIDRLQETSLLDLYCPVSARDIADCFTALATPKRTSKK